MSASADVRPGVIIDNFDAYATNQTANAACEDYY